MEGRHFNMPAITIGTVGFGTRVSREESFAQLDYYFAQGGTWIDTARVYGVGLLTEVLPHHKDSEETIGDWVRERDIRDKVTIVTKGAHWDLATKVKRVSPDAIRADIATSLQKLNMDYIDIYFLHNDDESVPVSEIMPVLHEIIQSGKARIIGASNWRVQRIQEANEYAQAHDLTPFSISQIKWSYGIPPTKPTVDMYEDQTQYEGYKKLNMPIMAYSAQAAGFFIKTAKLGFDAEALGNTAAFLSEENNRRAEIVKKIMTDKNISASAASLGYLWSREVPVTALIGCSTMEHLRTSLHGCEYFPEDPSVYE